MADALDAILPKGAVAVERGAIRAEDAGLDEVPELYPVEEKLIAGASERRRREFAEARWCAREALRRLGVAPGAIPATPDGAPVWPEGVVGSITHKGGYRAAVVVRREDLAGIGIDAEPDQRLPEGVLETIASPAELDRVEALLERSPGIAWDRLLFCAKEAAVKAAQPLGLGLAGVRSVRVTLELEAVGRTFSALAGAAETTRPIEGRWASTSGLLLSVASVRRGANAAE
jgi:4'-phosphopantetheinyl transferase EntD